VYLDAGALLLLQARDGGADARRLTAALEDWFRSGGEAVSSAAALLRVRLYWRGGSTGRGKRDADEAACFAALGELLAEVGELLPRDLARADELAAAFGLDYYAALHASLARRLEVDRIFGLECADYARVPGLVLLELPADPGPEDGDDAGGRATR